MKQLPGHRIHDLIERIARISAADDWIDDLNPTQLSALSYLGKANRFSRAPSQVAEFMAATRGTVSQTLKALARKQLIDEVRSDTDRRWISYNVTAKGAEILDRSTVIDDALADFDPSTLATLSEELQTLMRNVVRARNRKPFGLCKTCHHYQKKGRGGFCRLLDEELAAEEVLQICHEHQEAI